MNADSSIDLSFSNDTETVVANFPAPHRVAGFAALFRQLYAPDERASFRAASGILMNHADQAQDEQADHRRDELPIKSSEKRTPPLMSKAAATSAALGGDHVIGKVSLS